jgi:hypothetical protein
MEAFRCSWVSIASGHPHFSRRFDLLCYRVRFALSPLRLKFITRLLFDRFLANLIATVRHSCCNTAQHTLTGILDYKVFMLLDLNAVMSIIANVPAAIASTVSYHNHLDAISHISVEQIVACRAVRRLTQYTSQGPEIFRCVSRFHSSNIHSTTACLQF